MCCLQEQEKKYLLRALLSFILGTLMQMYIWKRSIFLFINKASVTYINILPKIEYRKYCDIYSKENTYI